MIFYNKKSESAVLFQRSTLFFEVAVQQPRVKVANGKHKGDYLAGVVIKRTNNDQTFYVHETAAIKEGAAPFKTEAVVSDGTTGDASAPSLKSLLQKLLAVKAQLDSGVDESQARFSIKAAPDGTRYVDVDVDQHLFDGLTPKEMQKQARKIILDRFKGTVVGEGDNRAFVNGKTASEYAYPARMLSGATKEAKMRASTEIDNLLLASTFIGHQNDDGRHSRATHGWDKYQTLFKVGDSVWSGEVSIMVTDFGRRLYDVTKIKDVTESNIGLMAESHAESVSNVPNTSITDSGDAVNGKIQFSMMDLDGTGDAKFSAKITLADAKAMQQLPRGSISQFTNEEIKKATPWAERFYAELGEKSPFFRAWFGDWRACDKGKVATVQIPSDDGKVYRGTVLNRDTGWEIAVSSNGISNTNYHAGNSQLSVKALRAIKPLLENAALLDTETHELHTKHAANDNIGFDHKLYAPFEMDGDLFIAKMAIEELFVKEGQTYKRFHNLKALKVIPVDGEGLSKADASAYTLRRTTGTIHSIADLYAAVKQCDEDFNTVPNDGRGASNAAPSKVVNADGTPKVVYHATDADFTVFDWTKLGSNTQGNASSEGMYRTSKLGTWFNERDLSGDLAMDKTMAVYLDIKRPYRTSLDALVNRFERGRKAETFVSNLKNKGYDGLFVKDGEFGSVSYVVFSPTQIKSATDNTGAFNRNDPDIRYSVKDLHDAAQDAPVDAVALRLRDGEIAERSVELLTNLAEKAHGAVEAMTPAQVQLTARGVADKIIRQTGSQYDRAELTEQLAGLYANVAGVTDWEDAVRMAADLGRDVLKQSQVLDRTVYEEYAGLRDTLRTGGIRLTDTQRQEIASQYGSVNEWRKQNFGRLRITNSGTPLDVMYAELAEQYPELFAVDTGEAEMPFALTAALDAVQPKVYHNPYGMDNDGAALDAGMEMLYGFFDAAIRRNATAAAEQARLELKTRMQEIRKQYKDKYEAQIKAIKKENLAKRQQLAKDYNKAMKELRAQNRKDITTARQGMEMGVKREEAARLRQQYLRLTDRRNAALDLQKARYQQMRESERARRAETAAASKYRWRIEQTATQLRRWMEQPSDRQHVPEFVKQPVLDALNALDMMGRTDAKTGSPRETLKGAAWRESLRALTDTMRGIQAEQDGSGNSLTARYRGLMMTIDPDLIPNLEAMVARLEGRSLNLRDMNAEQLKEIDQALVGIRAAITSMGKTWANARYSTVAALGDETVAQLGDKKARTRHDAISNFLEIGQLDSFSFFRELGEAAQTVLDGIYNGWQKSVSRIRQASMATDAMLGDLHIDRKAMRTWQTQTHTYTLDSGRKLTLTTAQAMDLYNLWQRGGQARAHILSGGVEVEDIQGGMGKRTAQPRALLTEGDVRAIIGALTEDQRSLCDSMRKYLSTEAAAWGNETSMELYLYNKFGEANYWPIRSSRDYLKTKGDEGNTMFNAIRNMGFTRALTPGAGNPVRLGDALQVYSDHIVQMATYNGLAAPVEDAMKWYNYTQREDAEGAGKRTIVTSVKEQLRLAMGKEGAQFVENLMRDVNGMSSGSYGAELGNSLLGKFKASAIAGSVRVMVQQPTAILRAAAEIDPKYLLFSHTSRKAVAEMQKYAPIAWWKAQGNFELGVGQSMRQIIVGDDTPRQRLQGMMMAGAGYMDDMTWGHLWSAVKAEVRANNPTVAVGGDAYFDLVRERFTDIVNSTQVVDSVFHRSQLMRSKDGLTKMATAFMAEPTKSYNLLRNAVMDAVRGAPGARGKAVRVALAWTSSVALNAAVKSLWDAWRKRGEDDDYWELFRSYWLDSFADDMNVLNMIPWVRDALSIIQGYLLAPEAYLSLL